MGVPGFYRWLCQRYPLIRRCLDDPSRPIFNNLYLDINSLIYNAISSTNFKGPELTDEFLSELFRNIDLQVQSIKPTDLIFIATDGVSPFAKSTQQRERRFTTAQKRLPDTFDFNSATPGTEFMYDLNDKIIEFIASQKLNDPIWTKNRVIYSGFFAPGEGEHKIIDFIRESRSNPDWNPNLVHCIPSNDADLLFLSLQTHEPYIAISHTVDMPYPKKDAQLFEARGSLMEWGEDSFEVVYISLLREYLSIDFNVKGEELELTIDDFIALSFLIGNDFIPFFNEIDIYNIYDDIINIYKTVRKNSPHLIEKGQFNKTTLKSILQKIVDFLHEKFKNEKKLDLSPEEIADLYRKESMAYFSDKFEDLKTHEKLICNSILDAFDWVLKYYREGCSSWRWRYPFLFSPPIELIIPYIDEHVSKFVEDAPPPPLLQLVSVIPPQSKGIVPEQLHAIYENEQLKHFFPEQFEILTNPTNTRQSTVLLPIIDVELIETFFNQIELPEAVSSKLNCVQFALDFYKEKSNEYKEIQITKGKEPFKSINLSTKRPTCIPTLEGLDYSTEETTVPVKIFRFPSTKPSIVIKPKAEPKTVIEVYNLIGSTVLINWPYLQPAQVIGMSDSKFYYNEQTRSFPPQTNDTAYSWRFHQEEYMKTMAIDIGPPSVLFKVVTRKSTGYYDTYINSEVPISLAMPIGYRPEIYNLFQNVEDRKPDIGETVAIVCSYDKSCIGKIVEKKSDTIYRVKIRHKKPFPIRQLLSNDARSWVTFQDLVKAVGSISFRGLRQCLTKVVLDPFNVNIALTLNTFDHRVLAGCCKHVNDQRSYLFSSDVPQIVVEYFALTGKLKSIVMNSISKKEKYLPNVTLECLYGGSEEYQKECYEKLTEWMLRKAPAVHLPLVNEDCDFLSHETIKALEDKVSTFDFLSDNETEVDYDVCKLVWKSKHCHQTSEPKVGNRVVSVASSGPALFGEIGTVIETYINADAVMVLFDNELPFASRLEGRLNTKRALRVSMNDLVIVANSA